MYAGIASRVEKELRGLYLDRHVQAGKPMGGYSGGLSPLGGGLYDKHPSHRAVCLPAQPLVPSPTTLSACCLSRGCACRVLKGEREGLRRLKLRVEDPPRRRHMVRLPASQSVALLGVSSHGGRAAAWAGACVASQIRPGTAAARHCPWEALTSSRWLTDLRCILLPPYWRRSSLEQRCLPKS